MSNEELLYMHLEYIVTEEQEGTFIQVPFQVPVNTQQIIIRYKVDDAKHNAIDFGVEDINGYRGWSNLLKNRIIIQEDYATEGYLSGFIESGEWKIILGIFNIRKNCKVTLNINIKLEQSKWYKGDLHTHSIHSDGSFTLNEVMDYVKEEGLEYIALTDHNTFSQNTDYKTSDDLVVIPGVELTTYKGHANFFGCKKPFSHFRYENIEDIRKYMEEGKANDAIISLNHPFHKDKWKWGLENFDFSYVEIWNSWFSEGNQRAIDWWHSMLCKGKKIIALGGSDFHRKQPKKWYGVPTTWVNSLSFNKRGILNGIRQGRVCVSAEPKAPMVDISIEDVFMGETYIANDSENVVLTCYIKQVRPAILKLYSSRGLVIEKKIEDNDRKLLFNVSTDTLFYRIELWNEYQQEPLCISNPIFIDNKCAIKDNNK
ncbi:CehA/McbA family metallohydrolase [Vallitalea guaymasensis]|uniref:CehA/McbA family metallohydrolase n=1 Tax=Vallitalea guaymasensis TaxID=1185412 RepID=UPI000DE497BB|nr:CehA/McbA family metallohydrolase [Vallitalea guaymasensis]